MTTKGGRRRVQCFGGMLHSRILAAILKLMSFGPAMLEDDRSGCDIDDSD